MLHSATSAMGMYSLHIVVPDALDQLWHEFIHIAGVRKWERELGDLVLAALSLTAV